MKENNWGKDKMQMKDFISLYRFNLKKMMGNWMTKLMFGIVVIGLFAGAFLYKEMNRTREIHLKVNNETELPLEAENVVYVLEHTSSNTKYMLEEEAEAYQDTLGISFRKMEEGYEILFDYTDANMITAYQKNSLVSIIETILMENSGISLPKIQIRDKNVLEDNHIENTVYYISIFVIYLFILLCGGIITGSVALEKTSKVSELLVYRVSPVKIIYSKVLSLFTLLIGIGVVAVFEVGVFNITGLMDVRGFIKNLQLGGIGAGSIGMILGILISGIAVYTILYIIVGMFIQSADQIQFAQFPVAAIALAAYAISILSRTTPDSWIARYSMYVPLFYPFVAPLRMIQKLCGTQEIVLSTVLLLLYLIMGNLLMSKLFRREAH